MVIVTSLSLRYLYIIAFRNKINLKITIMMNKRLSHVVKNYIVSVIITATVCAENGTLATTGQYILNTV